MTTPLPVNHAEFSLAEVVEATGGAVMSGRASGVRGVSTDTRHDLAGKLFVALSGARYDGHRFVEAAGRAGAAAVLVSEDVSGVGDAAVVRVPCTLTALGSLARHHRRRWGGTLVAIAGSAGKTTTRAAVGAVLEATCPGQVHATPGNLNNRVGVPLVLLGLRPEHRYAVVEVGTNATGEVAELNRVASPDVGVLTLVGLEHAAGLGELDAIEREEGSLLGDLPPSGIAVANGDDVRAVRQLDRSRAGTHVRYGTLPGCDVRLASRQATSDHLTRLVLQRASQPGQIEVDCRLMGLPGALAVAAGVAVADCLMPGILGQELIASALERLGSGEPGRLTPRSGRDGTLILDDSYNSNPASLYASLEAAREAASRRNSRLLLVLGEMRELGSLSGQEHASVGRALRQGEVLVGVAGDFRRAVTEARAHGHSAEFVENADEAIETVESRMSHGDVILIKGSRSVGLELVVQALTTGREGTA